MPACKWQKERPRSQLTVLFHLMESAVNCYSLLRTLFVRLPANQHGWWNNNEQESCVTLRSHLLESPFSLKFSELSPEVFARTWTTAHNYPNYKNLLLKQHTSSQNIPVTSSKCPSKAARSGTKIAKYKTTKSNKKHLLNWGKILSWVPGSLSRAQGLLELELLPVSYPPKLQGKQWETPSSGSAVYSVTQRHRGGLDPSSPACVFCVNTLPEPHGTVSLSLAGEGERGKS